MAHALRFHRLALRGERQDVVDAAAIYIDEADDAVGLGGDVALGIGHGVLETHIGRTRQVDAFEEHHLVDAVAHRLGEESGVVGRGLLIIVVDEPATHEGVALLDDHQRVEAGSLQSRGEQYGEVQTGAQLLFQHLLGEAHALPLLLKTGGWGCIDDAQVADGLEDGGTLGANAVGLLLLILVEGSIAREFLQLAGGTDQHGLEFRRIGRDEGGDQFWRDTHTRPLIGREDAKDVVLDLHFLAIDRQRQGESSLHTLREMAQRLQLELQVEVSDLHRLARRQHVKRALAARHMVSRQCEDYFLPILLAVVDHFHALNAFLAIAGQHITDGRNVLNIYNSFSCHTKAHRL